VGVFRQGMSCFFWFSMRSRQLDEIDRVPLRSFTRVPEPIFRDAD